MQNYLSTKLHAMAHHSLPRKTLGHFPTPVTELDRLSRYLDGPRLLMKRDDLTGLAMGGNKTRKLEFLMADALSGNYDVVVTAGAIQSNHCRQTAAAAAVCGLDCHLVLGGSKPSQAAGNYLLDQLLGAQIHFSGDFRKGETVPEVVEELKYGGYKPYVIPYGGSNELGAAAFSEALKELDTQLADVDAHVDHIIFASSSGATQAGLIVGKKVLGRDFEITGVEIDKNGSDDRTFSERVLELTEQTAEFLGVQGGFSGSDVVSRSDYLGSGYGVVGDPERQAIALTARHEGILLDPVYSGRAMSGLIDMITRGQFTRDETVLFWHTGGTPALFAYADELLS